MQNPFARVHASTDPGERRREVDHRRMGTVPPGYAAVMTITPEPPEDRPIDLEGVPAEEGISAADVSERLDKDPDEQDNQEELR